jgi:hypothetical protein
MRSLYFRRSRAVQKDERMPHTIKAGKAELTISSKRYGRHAWRMRSWSPERRSQAHAAAEKRLQGKHPRKRDAAIFAASDVGGTAAGNG